MSLWTPPHRPLMLPGSPKRRIISRPDFRHMGQPRLSGAPLTEAEVDYDDLIVNRHWRAYEDKRPGEVKYFMYELSQRNPGDAEHWHGFKAVRFARLTRVPRWLRQQSSGAGRPGSSQMAYILAALREQRVLFVQLVAKTPEIPLVFAYGVQAVGATPEEAQYRVDEAYAALTGLLDGTFQQIEYSPISLDEGERLARYQATWRDIAVARGRPMPNSDAIGASAILDGNRTDIEQTHNQMEAFIRGMSEAQQGFMLSLVTVPLSPEDMTLAWRNISGKLSEVRSETHGMKAFSAGVALPLSIGQSFGDSHGDNHSQTTAHGVGASEGSSYSEGVSHSQSLSDGVSASHTDGVSHSVADGLSHSQSHGVSQSDTAGVSESASSGHSQSLSDSISHSTSAGHSVAQGETLSHAQSLSHSLGETVGVSESQSASQSIGVSEGHSLAAGQSVGSNWSNSVSAAHGASLTGTDGWSQSQGESVNQSVSLSQALADSLQNGQSVQSGSSAHGGLLGFGGGGSSSSGHSLTEGITSTNTMGLTQTGGSTHSVGVTGSMARGLSETMTQGESAGGSVGQSLTSTASAGQSSSASLGQSLGTSHSQSATQAAAASVGQGQSLSVGQSLSDSAGVGRSVGAGANTTQAVGSSLGHTQGTSDTVAAAQSRTVSAGQSASDTVGQSRTATAGSGSSQTAGISEGSSQNQALSDAYAVAMSRQASSTGSLGVVPNFGITVSKQTLDAAKQVVGDILEETMRRYIDGVEGGAYLYQLFLVTEDRSTLMAGAALLKSAFWGPGTHDHRLAQPFHVMTDWTDEEFGSPEKAAAERERLLSHAQAFTSYRKREPTMEIIEPFKYSSYITTGELSAFARPPVAESIGLLAVHDSAPVMAMPADRQDREITLGYLFNGERARISHTKFGVDATELTHTLISGVTGSGKTTTLQRLLAELCGVSRTVVTAPTVDNPVPETKTVHASILGLDWMRNMRHLGSIVEPVHIDPATGEKRGRFQFFSVRDASLGQFCWNPLEVPAEGMNPVEWLNSMADNMVASWNLGEFGRSLIAEFLDRLYTANRLEPYELRPARTDDQGNLIRPAIELPALDPTTLPTEALGIDPATGQPVANVYTYPQLSRLVGVHHLAVIVAAEIEAAATVEGARMGGTSIRDRLQSVWRRLSYYAPGGQLSDLVVCDETLDDRRCLNIRDIIDPERGLVTIIETDGLDLANRRFILGSVLLAVYRFGLHHGEGCFDQNGQGVGLYAVLEEAHELFGEQGEDEDSFSASTRTALYESMHRRIRALGVRLIDVVQNPGSIPEAITSNTSTVFIHRTYADADRRRVFSLLNWSNMIGQQLREYRWLGEQPIGYCIARLHARTNFLESAPVQFVTEPASLGKVTDAQLAHWSTLS